MNVTEATDALRRQGQGADYFAELGKLEEAAGVLRAAALAGTDIGGSVEVLTEAYRHANDIGLLQQIADALVLYWLRVGDLDAMRRAIKRTRYPEYLLRAIPLAEKAGHDVEPLIPVLAKGGGDAWRALQGLVERRLERLPAALHALGPELARFVKDLAFGQRIDLGPAVPFLLEGLRGRRAKETAEVLRILAEERVPLDGEAVAAALPRTKAPETRLLLAYAAALDGIRQARWDRVDVLAADPDVEVRRGVLRALGIAWLPWGEDTDAIATRVAAFLLDPPLAAQADEMLKLSEQNERRAVPNDDVLRRLAEAGAGTFLYWLSRSGPDHARRVARATAGTPLGETLAQSGDACRICRHIPRGTHASHESDLPRGMARLERVSGERLRCPECGVAYRYGYEDEWDDMSHCETFTLERIAPRPDDATRARLTHVDPAVRREAAWALARHGEPLLDHPDPIVRNEAVRTLENPAPVLARLQELLVDAVSDTRATAAKHLATHWTAARDWDALAGLLAQADPDIQFMALQYLRHGADEAEDLERFGPLASALLESPRESVREQAAYLLRRVSGGAPWVIERMRALLATEHRATASRVLNGLVDDGHDVSPALPDLARMADDWYARNTIKNAAGRGADVSALLPLLVGASPDEVLEIVHSLLRHHHDITEALPFLASHLGDQSHGQRAVGILNEASGQGIDLTPALPALRTLAHEGDDAWEREQAAYALTRDGVRRGDWTDVHALLHARHHAAGACARTLAELDADLSPVIEDLRALVSSPDSYDRSMAQRALDHHASRGR